MRVNNRLGTVDLPLDLAFEHRITLTGPAGVPYWVAFDTDPGPTALGPFMVPVGLTANTLLFGFGQPFPAVGWDVAFRTADPSLLGITLHGAAAFVEASGITLTNGVAFTFVMAGADAGPDAATLTGRPVTLDGSTNLESGGVIPSGNALQWSVMSSPPGANPVLDNAQGAFPVFTADLPGLYTLELQVSGASGSSTDQVDVHAYTVTFTSPVDGSFSTSSVAITGDVEGHGLLGVEIDGQPVTLQGTQFSAGSLNPTATVNPVTARLTTATGQVLEHTVTVIGGMGVPLGNFGMPGTALRIGGASLDALEPPVELLLANLPLNTIIAALPPLPIIPTGLFTATLDFTGASFDPMTVDFDIFPSSGAIGIAITLNQLVITADLTGTIFSVPYAEVATISSTSAVISGELLIGSNAQGVTEVTIQNPTATLNGFNITATGALGPFIGILGPAAQTAFEAALAQFLNLIPPAINPLLSSLALSVDLTSAGLPLLVDLPLATVGYDQDGITIVNDIRITPTTLSGPALTAYLGGPGIVPSFGLLSPVSMVAYDVAEGINDDLLNQAFAAMVGSGFLDLDLSGSLGSGTGLVLTAGAMAGLVPDAGFGTFPSDATVTLQVRWTTAPAVTFSPTGSDPATLHIGNMNLRFLARDSLGMDVPILEVGATATAGVSVTVDPLNGVLSVAPGAAQVSLTSIGALAGTDASGSLATLAPVVEQILPAILAPLSSIPVPALPLGGGVVETSVAPGSPDFFITYVDLP